METFEVSTGLVAHAASAGERTTPYEIELTACMTVEVRSSPAPDVFQGSPIADTDVITEDYVA